MDTTVQALQRRLIALGISVGRTGADGIIGGDTYKAINAALDQLGTPDIPITPAAMTTSAAGRAAIAIREGNILTAYKDSVGVLTVGVGHTSAAGAPAVVVGMTITAAQSDEILSRDLGNTERDVRAAVTAPLSQNQFDALVSLAFNIGGTAFAASTLVEKLNAGDNIGAADQFLAWDKAGGKVLQGLVTRRASERKQFLTP